MSTSILPRIASRVLGPLLDATVVLSFDRTGYLVHSLGFDEADLDVDLGGRTCAVTGANSGLGEAAATALAARGATTWLLCRDAGRGEAAAERIRTKVRGADVHVARLDLSSLESIRSFARDFPPAVLDVLVHNAGVLPAVRESSVDGIEMTFATNVVGPFALTALLRRRLEAATQARVVMVSSGGMYPTRLDLGDWSFERGSGSVERGSGSVEPGDGSVERGDFDGVRAYSLTKRAEVVLAEMWATRFAGTPVTVNAMHPGWADTPGVRTSIPGFHRVMGPLLRSAEEGADTIVWLAVAPGLANTSGKFFFDRAPRATHWFPWTRESHEDRGRLWELCCRLGGVEA